MNVLPRIIVIIILTTLNAFFASAELAVLSVNKNRIKRLAKDGNKRAQAVNKLMKNETMFLSTIQVGITLAGFFSSATAATSLSTPVGLFLSSLDIPYGKQIAFILITLILSYLTLVFGELFPKRLARRSPEKIAMAVARPILFIKFIATPFVKFLSASTNLIVKITGIEKGLARQMVSEEDIRSMIESGVYEGAIASEEQKMIESIFKFDDLDAIDVMTPRVDVQMIDIDDHINDYIENIIEGKYSRYPVYQDNKDNIIGILHIKDLFIEARKVGFENINLKKLLRKPFFDIDRIKINVLYKRMQEKNTHIAILTDEFGGFRGIVALEDIIEEIMGNIYDEYDDAIPMINEIAVNTYLIDGSTPIQDINRELNLNFDESNYQYDTIGGLIISLLNRIPNEEEGLELSYKNVILKIKKMIGNRIDQIILKIKDKE